MLWGIRNRAQFLWLALDSAVDEVGRVTQSNRLVGWTVLGTVFGGIFALGLAALVAKLLDSVLPLVVVGVGLGAVVLLEGAYLEWVRIMTRGSPTAIETSGMATFHITGPVTINQYAGEAPRSDTETK